MPERSAKFLPRFPANSAVIPMGRDLNAWFDLIESRLPVAGKGMEMQQTPLGAVLNATAVGGGVTGSPCAFGYVYTHDGHTWLQGGQVYGGSGSFEYEELDLGETGSLPTTGYAYFEVDYTALTEDGVLLPGGDVTGVTFVESAESIPSNTMPTAGDPDGTVHVMLGSYTELGFLPSDCGNVAMQHCLGTLQYLRGATYF